MYIPHITVISQLYQQQIISFIWHRTISRPYHTHITSHNFDITSHSYQIMPCHVYIKHTKYTLHRKVKYIKYQISLTFCVVGICYTCTHSIYELHIKLRIFNILNFFCVVYIAHIPQNITPILRYIALIFTSLSYHSHSCSSVSCPCHPCHTI